MKFNEKLMSIRKTKGLSQEELGMELQVSRQTISKWESGQSYPDFQRLVMLSDYFDMTLDELVKDIDVQDVRDKNLTDEQVERFESLYPKISTTWSTSCGIQKVDELFWEIGKGTDVTKVLEQFKPKWQSDIDTYKASLKK